MNDINTIQKRFLLFLFGCIATRLFFVYLAKTINIEYLPYLGYLAILISVSFITLFITDTRKTGPEVFGDKIWWNHLRPIHAFLFALFAFYAIKKHQKAWIFLLIDVMIGFIAFLTFHYINNNFSKLYYKL